VYRESKGQKGKDPHCVCGPSVVKSWTQLEVEGRVPEIQFVKEIEQGFPEAFERPFHAWDRTAL